jgi:hypothetical protein
MADQGSTENPLQRAHAEAYKAYVRALQENLANIDVEALGAEQATAIPSVLTFNTLNSLHTYNTWNTWNTWNTIATVGTRATVATESSIQ